MTLTVFWRDDLDAVAFEIPRHDALCVMHRRAFRVIIPTPDPQSCIDFVKRNPDAFLLAARAKIRREALPRGRNLHINSRDLRRALDALGRRDG